MSISYLYRTKLRHILKIILLGIFLIACDNNEIDQSISHTLSGSVGDGPITQAKISVTDANGIIGDTSVSDSTANYSVNVAAGSAYPILITTNGGTDVVTGGAPDFTMVSVAADSTVRTVNINPFSTLIVKTAQAMPNGLTAENLLLATEYIVDHLNYGLNQRLVSNPITTAINEANVADIIKASETMGEAIRRTRSALLVAGIDITADEIVLAIAGDMTDGVLDGSGPGANGQVAAVANVVSAQVLIESLGNNLYVGGDVATARMDSAIKLSTPSASITTADVLITDRMLTQTRKTVTAAQTLNSNLSTMTNDLAAISANSLAASIDVKFPQNSSVIFDQIIAQAAQSTESEFAPINASVREGKLGSTPAPISTPNAGIFEFAIATYSVGESDGAVDITINRIGGSSGAVTLTWRTWTFNGRGTADFNTDYVTFVGAQLTFADGELSKTEKITILPDSIVEGDETFEVVLTSSSGGATLGSVSTTVVTILDDDTVVDPTPTPTPPVPTPTPPTPPSARPWEDLLNNIVGFGNKTTGGKGGMVCQVINLSDSGVGSLRDCATRAEPQWIRFAVSGTINLATDLRPTPNKTIDGRGQNITLSGRGIVVSNVSNVIIHNIKIVNAAVDGIRLFNSNTKNIWIDHCTFNRAADEMLSVGLAATDITISWNKFEGFGAGKGVMIGSSPTNTGDSVINITMHHNFLDGLYERNPLVRYAKFHLFNNYINWGAWGGDAVSNTYFLSENNIWQRWPGSNSNVAIIARAVNFDNIPPASVKSVGDWLVGDVVIETWAPQNMFDPLNTYTYNTETADQILLDKLISKTGWQLDPTFQ